MYYFLLCKTLELLPELWKLMAKNMIFYSVFLLISSCLFIFYFGLEISFSFA